MSKERKGFGPDNERVEFAPIFPHNQVERKWMHRWVEDGIFTADNNSSKPEYFILDMYPYPSGSGLHVGHVEGYTATDILSRYKRMNGFEVLHPMGWDAFGLPTENFAIKTGRDPHEITAENTAVFRDQCVRTGFGIDWGREVDTSSPEYYKWTQKLFLDLYERGLAYKAKSPVNWCTGCNTVIANEQVEEGHCERCDSDVELRNIEQWFFRITAYADRLLDDLDDLDWPESTKERQRKWIDRTEGTEISLDIDQSDETLTIFTTNPEELAKPLRIVLAPEHPDLDRITTDDRKSEISSYKSGMTPQSEIDRKKHKDSDPGVFTGRFVINPLNGNRIEVWTADHVVMDKYGGVEIEVLSDNQGKEIIYQNRKSVLKRLGNRARPAVRYNLRDWLVSRERYWGAPIPIVHCESCGDQPVPESQLPILLPQIDDFRPTGVPPLAKSEEFLHARCPHCGGNAERETKTLDTFVDSAWYYLRFADPRNANELARKELLEKWLPVDYYVGGSDHATGHLLYARFITKVLHDLGRVNFDEPFTRLFHQGLILGEDGRKMSKRLGNVVNPVDVSNEYGSDALRVYEMFLGPLERSKIWDTNAITGSRRLIDRVWRLQQNVVQEQASPQDITNTNELIENITDAIESGRFNIAISDFMKYMNSVDSSNGISRQSYETLLKLFAPFAPFVTEELWERLGNEYSIHQTEWPEPIVQEGFVKTIDIPVMINGKVIGTVSQPEGTEYSEEEMLAILRNNPELADRLSGNIRRTIYKPNTILNILT